MDAPGGRFFCIALILETNCSHIEIAFAIDSSGIAGKLLEGDGTAHSELKLHFNIEMKQTC